MTPVGERSLERAMDAVSAGDAPERAHASLVAPFPAVETTTMKSRGDSWRRAVRIGFILLSATFSWLLIAFVLKLIA